jgi:hypothetical protein
MTGQGFPDDISRELGFSCYKEYLCSPLWKKIKRRVLERDEFQCARCSGKANLVHHLVYTAAILNGDDDSHLVAICDGCHSFVHTDEGRQKRAFSDWNTYLRTDDLPDRVFNISVDRRRTKQIEPADWKRMSIRERHSWENQYQKRRFLKQLEKHDFPMLRTVLGFYGIDNKDCQLYLSLARPLRRACADLFCTLGHSRRIGGNIYQVARVVAVYRASD